MILEVELVVVFNEHEWFFWFDINSL